MPGRKVSVRIPQEDFDFIKTVCSNDEGVEDITMTEFLLRIIKWIKPTGRDHLRRVLGVELSDK